MTASTSPPGADPQVPRLTEPELEALADGAAVVRDRVAPDALTEAVRDRLEAWWRAGALRAAGVGAAGARVEAVRGDHTAWLDDRPDEATAWLGRWFGGLREGLAEDLRLALPSCRVQLARYPGGAGYARHLDALRHDPRRRVTAILYLDPAWQPAWGGLLRLWEPAGVREVEPRGGRLVVFRADAVAHEVLPTAQPRYAATAWLGAEAALP